MSITSIKIIGASGSEAELTTRMRVRGRSPMHLGVDKNMWNTVVLSRDSDLGLFAQALEQWLNTGGYISSIGGAKPNTEGHVLLFTDQCMAWKPESNILEITDLCPACNDCGDYAAVLARLEWLLLGFNNLKDMALNTVYNQSVNQDYLLSQRIVWEDEAPLCKSAVPLKYREDNILLPDKITNMLANYLTIVQMWNYVVSQNNTSNQISSAAEDSSGLLIQTKRDLPVCGSSARLICDIDIMPDAVEDGLSVAIVEQKSYFYPFDDAEDVANITVEHVDAVTKKVHAVFNSTGIAGTYELSVKVMPFIAITLKDDDGNEIDMSDISWDVETETEEEEDGTRTETFKVGAKLSDIFQIPEATEDDYNKYKVFPSHSVDGLNRWKINIKWTLSDMYMEDKSWEETYLMETNKCRRPITGILRDWTIVYPGKDSNSTNGNA